MDSDSKRDTGTAAIRGDVAPGDNTTRARNRTVMLTPELTGSMRTRLGGQSAGEVFEAVGVANRAVRELPEQEWESPLGLDSAPTGDVARLDGQEPEQKTIGWDTTASAVDFEPEDVGFMQPEPDVSATDDNGFQAPRWDEPTSELPNDARVISPARIVRPGASSSVGKVDAYVPETENPWNDAGATNQTTSYEEEDPLAVISQSFETGIPEGVDFEPQMEAERHEKVFWRNPSQLVGFLVSYDHEPLGSYVELRKGRLLVTSEGEVSGNCLVISHGTVSPMHAIMRIAEGGSVQVLDQLSEHGTRIVRGSSGEDAGENVLLSGDKASLRNGDILSFGERNFHVCLVTAA